LVTFTFLFAIYSVEPSYMEAGKLTLAIRQVPRAAEVSLPHPLGVHQRVLTMPAKRRPHATGRGRRV
jgi:hypothetical protein